MAHFRSFSQLHAMSCNPSYPVPLDPKTDVRAKVKLNQTCVKCSKIGHHVAMLRKSCRTNPDNDTFLSVDHHESSDALIISARTGCHLYILLLAQLDDYSRKEDLKNIEARAHAEKKQVDYIAQPKYQLKLRGILYPRSLIRRRNIIRTIVITLNRFTIERDESKRFSFCIGIDIDLPHEVTRDEVSDDIYTTYLSLPDSLFIKHQTGRSLVHRSFGMGREQLTFAHGFSAREQHFDNRQDPSTSTASPSSFDIARE